MSRQVKEKCFNHAAFAESGQNNFKEASLFYSIDIILNDGLVLMTSCFYIFDFRWKIRESLNSMSRISAKILQVATKL